MKSNFFRRNALVGLVVLILLNLLLMRTYVDFQPGALDRIQGDATYYHAMAVDPSFPALNPYVFRTLTPRIVGFLHDHWQLGYTISWLGITFVASVLMEWCFFLMMFRSLRYSTFMSLLSSLMIGLTYWFTVFNYQDIWLTDPLNNLFWICAIWSLIVDRYALFFIIAAVGFLNKEIVLLLVPLAPLFIYLQGSGEQKPNRTNFWVSVAATVGIFYIFSLHKANVLQAVDPSRSLNALAGAKGSVQENVSQMTRYFKDLYFPFSVFNFLWVGYFYATYLIYNLYGWKNKLVIFNVYLFSIFTVLSFFISDVPRVFALLTPVVFLTVATYWRAMDNAKGRNQLLTVAGVYSLLNLSWPSTYGTTPGLTRDTIMLVNLLVLGWVSTWVKDDEIALPKKLVFDKS